MIAPSQSEPVPLSPAPALPEGAPACGTEHAASELHYRPATVEDVEPIHALIEAASQSTTVLPRSRDSICEHLQGFIVADRSGAVLACGALAIVSRGLAEIKSLVVAPELRGQGVGGHVVQALVEQARSLGLKRIFALTDNVRFFQRQGFSEVSKGSLPHKVWTECIRCPKFFNCNEDAVELLLE